MSEVVVIALALGWTVSILGFLFLFHKLDEANKKQEDMLLERIQRPEFRPVPLEDIPEPTDFERSDLDEMAAVGMIDPTLSRDNGN